MQQRNAIPSDSVPIDADSQNHGKGSQNARDTSKPKKMVIGVKSLFIMFALFLFVVSDIFTNSVISGFSGAVKGRTATTFGTVLQGIFLVLFYIVANHLISIGVI